MEGSVFWDQGHTSETGNMIIAEKIYEISLPIIKDSELNNHDMFHNILKKYNNTKDIEIIAAELSHNPERDEIIQFVENSQRGIMKGYFQRS